MKFVDQAKIYISSGHGGAGCVSFRREKYIPKGGPDGGDGGRGGDVVIEAVSQKETLLRFHLNQHFQAGNGRPGQGRRRSGEAGPEVRLAVPPGTVVFDADTDELLADLAEPGAAYLAAKGGRGGLGNCNFASGGHRTPRYAQPGEDGFKRRLRLELRLLADAGLVGYPNVGKSTLISKVSAAKPKIADYPFTTLTPNLGVVAVDGERDYDGPTFVMADLPGLIDGAAKGAGLGHQFLKHLSRCAVLVHVLDPLRLNLEQPERDLEKIKKELRAFDHELSKKPRLIAVSKMDLAEGLAAVQALRKAKPRTKIFPFSSATGEGLLELKRAIWQDIAKFRAKEAAAAAQEKKHEED
ncbi:MAG: GTPase ObgE [Candidatus Adiutrix sp.]|jgi:GTP-binding protein|nr:GTPase ObgE [Candidatus Adiutrix sp.]